MKNKYLATLILSLSLVAASFLFVGCSASSADTTTTTTTTTTSTTTTTTTSTTTTTTTTTSTTTTTTTTTSTTTTTIPPTYSVSGTVSLGDAPAGVTIAVGIFPIGTNWTAPQPLSDEAVTFTGSTVNFELFTTEAGRYYVVGRYPDQGEPTHLANIGFTHSGTLTEFQTTVASIEITGEVTGHNITLYQLTGP